jgi:VWFA-related protein
METQGWSKLAVAVCMAGGLISATAARAENAATAAAPAFGDEVDVRVVNLEAVVTDGRGNRVKGLKPGDFRLLIDGRTVPVEYFTEVSEGMAIGAPAAAGTEPAPAGPPSALPQGETVGTNYLVFVDDYFAVGRQRDDVLGALKRDLPRLGPADRMSIVAWDGGGLARLADWTGSQTGLAAALDRAMRRPARGLDRRADFSSFLDTQALETEAIEGTASLLGGDGGTLREALNPGLTPLEREYGLVLSRQVQSAVIAVMGAMRGSAAPSGRKVLLLLSGGWPFSLQSYLRGSQPIPLGLELPSGEKLLQPLARTANLLGYTIYPVDVPGISSVAADIQAEPFAGQTSQASGAGGQARRSALGDQPLVAFSGLPSPQPAVLTDTGSFQEQEIEGSLWFLAQETGGKPILNSNRMVALTNAAADTRSYYQLAFTPSWQYDDKPHTVRIEALQPGLKVRSRASFVDLSRRAQLAMTVESALLFGGVAGAEPLGLRLGKMVQGGRRGTQIPISLTIPTSALTAVELDGRYTSQIQLRFAAVDDRGNQSDIPAIAVKLSGAKPPAAGQYVQYDTRIVLNGRANRIVAAVFDPLSGKIAAGEIDVPSR